MADVEETQPPSLDYGEDDLAALDKKESTFSLRMQTLMGKKFEDAIIAIGEVPTAFVDALTASDAADTAPAQQDPSHIKITGHPPLRVEPIHFTATFEIRGSVAVCKCEGMLRSDDAASFTQLVRSHVSAKRYICLGEAALASYQATDPPQHTPMLRYLATSSEASRAVASAQRLEPPNALTSIAAAMISGCEWDGVEAYAFVSYREGAGVASQLHVDDVSVFQPALSSIGTSLTLDDERVRAFCKKVNRRPVDTLLYT
ncbi:hypothetical protein PTSG_08640 [Salpingoeca rosetta]|uniref:Proteasome assembly chaperone 1 n=1 Tax=Salpingoeca rosetta (strain ATCC 50818 / BSB-021) TaxID=946362 RepID=F2UK93_SALR5|nr:uncharacterized protein PTSG_08640 [Salpingoeca rosetta]EGD77542.1 hypothetical protein PTSG_08640 [Salpingoeca rosetta]|eukprot:XP_004990430.1 hypothetical protein PTSG_08640 [Salpingoeca rosetta]